MKKIVLTLVITMLASLAAVAANYYCAPDGKGNGTSVNAPCSFTSGLSKLREPGDTLYLLDGVYYQGSKITINRNGSQDKNIAVFAYPGARPIIDFSQQPYGSSNPGISVSDGATYLHFRGLTIRYAGDNGMIMYGSHCTIEQCEFYGNCDTGLQLKRGHDNRVINCDSHDNFDYQTGGVSLADFGGNADGFADKQYTSQGGNYFYGCRAWNNSDDGWDFYQHVSQGSQTVVENCICLRNGPTAYDMTNHPRYQTDKAWFDQFAGSGKDVVDSDSQTGGTRRVTLQNYVNWGNGNGFKLGGGRTNHNVEVRFCLAVDNSVRGFDQNNNAGVMNLYNNSGYRNNPDFGFNNNSFGTLVARNNLSYASRKANNLDANQTTHDHNSWDTNGITPSATDFCSLDTSLILAPRQADGSLPENLFMRLMAGSKLIDAGVDVGLPYGGAAPDMGCYESGDMTNYPPALTCLTSNLSQSITEGQSIADITCCWSGGATGLAVSTLPAGLAATTDTVQQTLTISGAPAAVGRHDFTITTIGGNGTPATLTATISVKSATAIPIVYITTPNSAADAPILDHLNNCPDLSVTEYDVDSKNIELTNYRLAIISPVPNSSNALLQSLKGANIPTLLLKAFLLKNTAWDWGKAANSTDTRVRVLAPEHPVFANLPTDSENMLSLFTQNDYYAVTCITGWTNSTTPTLLAAPEVAENYWTVAEMKAGDVMNGTTLRQPLLMIGLSEYSTAHLTPAATQLVENACRYLLGLSGTSAVSQAATPVPYVREPGLIRIPSARQATLCDLSGRILRAASSSPLSPLTISLYDLPAGLYLLRIDGHAYKIIK